MSSVQGRFLFNIDIYRRDCYTMTNANFTMFLEGSYFRLILFFGIKQWVYKMNWVKHVSP